MTPRRPTPPRSSRGSSRPREAVARPSNGHVARSHSGDAARSQEPQQSAKQGRATEPGQRKQGKFRLGRARATREEKPQVRSQHSAPRSANTSPGSARGQGTARAKQSRPATSPARGVGEALSQNYAIRIRGRRGVRQYSAKFLIFSAFLLASLLILAPPLTRSIEQSHEVASAHAQLEEVRAHREELQRQLNLWQDENYIRSQARERLGYVMPGETLYSVKLPGESEDRQQHVREVNRTRLQATPWFVTLWESMRLADAAGESGEVDNPQQVPVIEEK